MIEHIVFYSLSTVVLVAAVCVVTMRNTHHSPLFPGPSTPSPYPLAMREPR